MHKIRSCLTRCVSTCALALLSIAAVAQPVPPELMNGLKWRLIGPFRGGRVVAVAGVPGDSTTFYFGSVNGGIWKTTDAGVVWTPIFDGQPVASIGALAVAPSDPKTIYAGTGETDIREDLSSGNGVYKSTDGGATWSHIGLEDTRQISRIVIDPQNPNVVYVGALGHAFRASVSTPTSSAASTNPSMEERIGRGFSIWGRRSAFQIWRCVPLPRSFCLPAHGIRIVRRGARMLRSMDPGAAFTVLRMPARPGLVLRETGCPKAIGDAWASTLRRTASACMRSSFSRLRSRPRPRSRQAKKSGLYRSDDGGNTWVLANADPRLTSRAWYFNRVTIDPHNPDVLYIPNVALYRSEDGGKTISVVRGAPGGDDYHQLWIDPKNSASMVLGTDQGTTISLNRGQTWSSWYNQPTAQLYHVTTDNQFPYVVYGTQQDSGSAAVVSRTDHAQITPRDWFPAGPARADTWWSIRMTPTSFI